MAAAGVRAWQVPVSSPDLNPVEKFWAWLRRRLRAKDCEDLRRRPRPIGKMTFKACHPRLVAGSARGCWHGCWLPDDLQEGRGQEREPEASPYARRVHRFRNCQLNAAVGRNIVALHVAVEHLANPFSP